MIVKPEEKKKKIMQTHVRVNVILWKPRTLNSAQDITDLVISSSYNASSDTNFTNNMESNQVTFDVY